VRMLKYGSARTIMTPAPRTRAHRRAAHHDPTGPVPEAGAGLDASGLPPHPQGVHPVAHQREDGGEQRHRRGDSDHHDEDRASGECSEDRRRHDEDPEQREHDRHPAEEHSTVRGRARVADRLEPVAPVQTLLAVTGHDEQGVVDPDSQADHRDHVLDEEREREGGSDQGGDAHRGRDREDSEKDRDHAGDDRTEDHDEHDEGDDDPDALASLNVLFDDLLELVEQRCGAGDVRLESLWRLDRPHRSLERPRVVAEDVLVGARHQDREQDRSARLRDGSVLGEVAPH
jgi:hypothetical protein